MQKVLGTNECAATAGAAAAVAEAGGDAMHDCVSEPATAKVPPLFSMQSVRIAARDASVFHIANTTFWEAALLPMAVVVVIAFSSCTDTWIGQFISLSCWYAANFYAMAYTLQVLHPQACTLQPLDLHYSPFGGIGATCLWSGGIASLELAISQLLGQPSAAQAVGTTLYSFCGCVWLYVIAADWRLDKVIRYVVEHRLLELPRRPTVPTVPIGATCPAAADAVERPRPRMRSSGSDGAATTFAGQVALLLAGCGLLVSWHCATGQIPPGTAASSTSLPLGDPYPGIRRSPSTSPAPTFSVRGSGRQQAIAAARTSANREEDSAARGTGAVNGSPQVSAGQLAGQWLQEKEHGPSAESKSLLDCFSSGLQEGKSPCLARNGSLTARGVSHRSRSGLSSSSSSMIQASEPSLSSTWVTAPAPTLAPSPQVAAQRELLHQSTAVWGGVILLGLAAMLLLRIADHEKPFEFSVPYLMCYNLVCLRVPDLLGHVVISIFGDIRLYSSPAVATTAISIAYMAAMQGYIVILRWVCDNMGSPQLFPRFQFVAQMYYYLFWYMMLMVLSPGGIEDWNFWLLVAMLNANYLVSNTGALPQVCRWLFCCNPPSPSPPLQVLFDAKLAVQDQLADVVSLLVVPAIATSFHVCASLSTAQNPGGALLSLWQRFGALFLARLATGLLTEEIFRRRVQLLYKADAMEVQLLPLDTSQNRMRYLNDICVGPKLAHESIRNIERCQLYFTAVAVICTFSVFQHSDAPARYAFISFGM